MRWSGNALEVAANTVDWPRLTRRFERFTLFHIDHILPRQHGGGDHPDNLALACDRCSPHKGSNLAGIDDDTGAIVPLFHPRTERWEDHFSLDDIRIIGLTPTGRATVRVCGMNVPRRLRLRLTLQARR